LGIPAPAQLNQPLPQGNQDSRDEPLMKDQRIERDELLEMIREGLEMLDRFDSE
jgi:hypothetical protein